MAIFWPVNLLKPQSIMVDINPRNMKGPTAQSGFVQTISNSAGLWKATFYNVPVYNASMIRAWRAIFNQAEGQLNEIEIPVWDYPRSPMPSGVVESDFNNNSVPHSDDSPFDDDTEYESSLITASVGTVASAGAVSLTVTKSTIGTIEPGHRFSINGRLYEINSVSSQDDSTAVVKIRPPLREAVTTADNLVFDYPTLKVRLASDTEMQLPLNFNKQSFQTVNFIEAL